MEETTTNVNEEQKNEQPIAEEPKTWTLEKDFEEIEAYFKNTPKTALFFYNNLYHIQIAEFRHLEKYTDLKQCVLYKNIDSQFEKKISFTTKEEALEALKVYLTPGVIFPIIDSKAENGAIKLEIQEAIQL